MVASKVNACKILPTLVLLEHMVGELITCPLK